MYQTLIVLPLILATAFAVPTSQQRIAGGSVVTIDRYPEVAATLISAGAAWLQGCGSAILNNRAVVTGAHCIHGPMRIRVGSAFSNSGGTVYIVSRFIRHPNYTPATFEHDIAILHVSSQIIFVNNAVRPASIAGANYNLADNQVVWAVGWGSMWIGSGYSEQLRHVQLYSINQELCRTRYALRGIAITADMLCAARLGEPVGQCGGDSGSPLFHNGNVVGLCAFGIGCGDPFFPSVNVRISRYTAWIVNNA